MGCTSSRAPRRSWSKFLESMRFMLRVEPADVSGEYALLTLMGPDAAAGPPGDGGRCRAASAPTSSCPGSRWPGWPPSCGRPGRGWPGCGRTRRCGSRPTSRGSAWTPITGRSRTRPAGSRPPCTWTRAATEARKPWPGCTTWATRRGGWSSCSSTGASDRLPAHGDPVELDGAHGRVRRVGRPALRARADRAGDGEADRTRRQAAAGRRRGRRPGDHRRRRTRALTSRSRCGGRPSRAPGHGCAPPSRVA